MRNRSDDEAFDFYFDGEHRLWKWLQLYGVLTGMFWVMVVLSNVIVPFFPFVLRREVFKFDRLMVAFMDSLNKGYANVIRLEAMAAIALHVGIVWGLGISPLYYLAMYFGFGFTWMRCSTRHHFGTDRDVVNGCGTFGCWGRLTGFGCITIGTTHITGIRPCRGFICRGCCAR